MDNSDTSAFRVEDIWAAFGLLTRLPLPHREWDEARPAAQAVWAYPFVGVVVALTTGAIAHVLAALGLPAGVVAAAALLTLSLLTGAMHEDGLADCADGLWGGFDRKRRLEIMKDSHIGAYGVIALIAGFALRWSALSALIAAGMIWTPLIVAAAMSRAGVVAVMATMPHARDTGLSHLTGRPNTTATGTALVAGVVIALIFLGFAAFWVLLAGAAATLACRQIAQAKIGGQTGDILGATQQVCEIVLLATCCVLVL